MSDNQDVPYSSRPCGDSGWNYTLHFDLDQTQKTTIKHQTNIQGWLKKQIQHSNTLVETGKQLCRRSELPLPPLALPFFHAHASIREVSHNWGPQHSISQHHEWDSAIHGISSYENEGMTIDHDTCKLKWFGHTSVGGWATSLYERQWRSSSQVGWKIDIYFKHVQNVQTCSNMFKPRTSIWSNLNI